MKDLSRRTFVKSGLAAVLVGGSMRASLREALAQAKATGKPLLTIGNLNRLFADKTANKVLAAEVVQSGKLFLTNRFTLTAIQVRALKAVPPLKVKELQAALAEVAHEGGLVHFGETQSTVTDKNVSVTTPKAPQINVAFTLV